MAARFRAVSERSTTNPAPSFPSVSLAPGENTLSLTGIAAGFGVDAAAAGDAPAASAIRAVAARVNKAEGSLPARFRCGERLTLASGVMVGLLWLRARCPCGLIVGTADPSIRFAIPISDREPKRRFPAYPST